MDPRTTRAIYDKSLKGFEDWLWSQNLVYEEVIRGPSEVCDTTVVEYLQLCYDCGMPKSTSGALISAIQDKRPALKRNLPAAWRAHAAWTFLEPSEFRTPWPWELVLAVVYMALCAQRWDLAIWLLLSFEGLLRPGETCALVRGDLRLPSDFTYGNKDVVIITIRVPKTRRRSANTQHILLRDRRTLRLLEAFAKHRPAGEILFPRYAQVRYAVYKYLGQLHLPPGMYSLGGLRGGGATHRYVNEEDTMRIMRLGRWTSVKTLDHYLQEAACLLSTLKWPELAHAAVQKAASAAIPYLLFSRGTT